METASCKGEVSPEKLYWIAAASETPLTEVEKAVLAPSGFTQIEPPQSSRPATIGKPLAELRRRGALRGDAYPLTYDENGYPELPPCLDRRKKAAPLLLEAA